MNPAIKALKQLLGTALDDVDVLDYGTAKDFEKLWKFEGLSERILIVWGRTAGDGTLWPIDASACLSPLDWAATYARHLFPEKAEQEQAEKPEEPIKLRHWAQIMILDADPTAHAAVPTVAHFHTLREDQLPWLTVPKEPGLKDVCQWLAARASKIVDQTTQDALTRFLREIRLNLTEVRTKGDYDRHAISNIVAPMVLLGESATKTRHSEALLKLLKACDLCALTIAPPSDDAAGNNYEILLVDDQAEHGWKDWIKTSLKPSHFQYRTNPYDLLDNLKDQFAKADKKAEEKTPGIKAKDLRFNFQLPGIENATNPVLFLDLRLFSGNADAERAFFQRLLKLIEDRFLGTDLAWPGLDQNADAFQKAKTALAQAPEAPPGDPAPSFALESPAHHEALTWLPRVIALADMSLPIVVFSSTDRSTIRQAFAAYGNIFTSFQKPGLALFAQKSSSSPKTIGKESLHDIIEQVKHLLAVREKCLKIRKLSDSAQSNSCCEKTEFIHVELYIDEDSRSDETKFAVGGVFAVFSSSTEADRFEDVCVENGVRYFKEDFFNPNVNHDKVLLKFHHSGAAQLKKAQQQLRENGIVSIGTVRLRRGAIGGDPQHFLYEDQEDLRFWRMLEAVIELFCSESLPAIKRQFNSDKVSFSVYIGTRMSSTKEQGDFSYRGNIELRHSMLRSLGDRDAFPVTLKGLSLHKRLNDFTLVRASALALPYKPCDCGRCRCESKTNIDRVVFRQGKTVFKFNPAKHVQLYQMQIPAERCYGRVLRRGGAAPQNQNRDQYAFVQVEGIGQVFCYWSDCQNFGQLNIETCVRLDVVNGDRGPQGIQVTQANDADLNQWIDQNYMEPRVSDDLLGGRDFAEFRPDYRALHYIADQVMRYRKPFSGVLSEKLAGQFDEDYTPSLENSLIASRLLDDNKHLPSALSTFSVDSDAQRDHDPVPLARAWTASRIWEELSRCKGDVIIVPQILQPSAPAQLSGPHAKGSHRRPSTSSTHERDANSHSDVNSAAPRPSAGDGHGKNPVHENLEAALKTGEIIEKSPSKLLTPQDGSGKNTLIANTPFDTAPKCSIGSQVIDQKTPNSKLDPSDRRISIQKLPDKGRLGGEVPKGIRHVDLQEYKIRHFWNETEYREANIYWHNILGFYVRKLENGEILVFAVMWFRPSQSNLIGFIEPNLKAFTDDGKPIGQAWNPTSGTQSSGW